MGQEALDKGVLYWVVGTAYHLRLLVSLHTLRKHYHGPITIQTTEKDTILPEIATYVEAKVTWDSGPKDHREAFVGKTRLPNTTPFRKTIYLDADTTVEASIDDLWPLGQELVLTRNDPWTIADTWRKIAEGERRLPRETFQTVLDHKDSPAINTGVMGFPKNHPIAQEWEETTQKLKSRGRDESAMMILYHRYEHRTLPVKYNRNPQFSTETDTVINHYFGKRHAKGSGAIRWLRHLLPLWTANTANVREWAHAIGDHTFSRFLRGAIRQEATLTEKTWSR